MQVGRLIEQKQAEYDKWVEQYTYGKALSKYFGATPTQLSALFVCTVAILISTGFRLGQLITISTYLYLGYVTFLELKAKNRPHSELLTTWVCYATYAALEAAFPFICNWIPAYNLVKLIFMLVLAHEQTRGARFMYEKLVRPFFERYALDIQNGLDAGQNAAGKLLQVASASIPVPGKGQDHEADDNEEEEL